MGKRKKDRELAMGVTFPEEPPINGHPLPPSIHPAQNQCEISSSVDGAIRRGASVLKVVIG